MSLLDKTSLCITPNAVKAGKLYSVIPNAPIGDMTVVRATTATRVNSAGLIESVAVNVPRLNYDVAGGCPSLLVEPQRTNLLTYSDNIALSLNVQSNTTVTSDVSISPDGTQNADNVLFGTSSYRLRVVTILPLTNYTASIFFKNVDFTSSEEFALHLSDGVFGSINATIKPSNGTATFTRNTSGWSSVSGNVESYGNGWYRVSVSGASIGGGSGWYEISSNVSKSILIWGAQLEQGSYTTSYVPTVATSVTRNADVISKTGISSLIGQTEGTIFVDITLPNASANDIFTFNNEGVNDVFLASNGGNLLGRIYYNGNPIFFAQYAITSSGGRFKMLITYKSGNSSFYVNGTLLSNSTTSFAFTNTLSTVNLTNNFYSGANKRDYNSTQLYKTALTDTECINLTTL